MRLPFRNEEDPALDGQIDSVLESMAKEGVDSEKYPKLMSYLERLNKLKQQNKLPPVSRDTLVIVGGNFLLGLLVVMYERKDIWTSKVPIPFTRTGKT